MSEQTEQGKLMLALVDKIRPILAGNDPDVIGAVLVELTATLWAGTHPGLRSELMELHRKTIEELVPIVERELFATRERPKDWPPVT